MIKKHFALCTLLHEQQLQFEANLILIRFIKVHSLVISLFHPLLKLLVMFFPSITTVCQLNWIDWVDASSSSGEKNCTQCTIQPQHFGPTSLFYILSKCFLIYCPRIQFFTKKKYFHISAREGGRDLFRVFRSEQNAFVENNDISPLREKAFLRVTALQIRNSINHIKNMLNVI